MLTLITATLNAEPFIERAIASAERQREPMQHIVVDGGSNDRTVALVRAHPGIDVFVVPGCSIYEAWNIGVDHVRGDAVMFLNADDELMPDAVERVAAALAADKDADIVGGRAQFVDSDTSGRPPFTRAAATSDRLDLPQLTVGVPAINAMAFRLGLFKRFGLFDTVYRVAGDRAFLLRLAMSAMSPRVTPIDAILYRYYIHTGSLTLQRGLRQRTRIARDHIALARDLLAGDPPPDAALWVRHMRQRDACAAALRCLAAGHVAEAIVFAAALVG